MGLSEFELVERFFARAPITRPDVVLGIGDDAAILRPRPGQDVVTVLHTMTASIAAGLLPKNPDSQARAALAVPLSRLAATGAEPAWISLALTVPNADAAWLTEFSEMLMTLAKRFGVQLTGGDSCRGPFSATVLASGFVPSGERLQRQGARPGDLLVVTGAFGFAREQESEPRVAEGMALRGLASAVTDLPTGLHSALACMLQASSVGARLTAPGVTSGAELDAQLLPAQRGCYELCFALPPAQEAALLTRFGALRTRHTRIGIIEPTPGIRYGPSDDPTKQ